MSATTIFNTLPLDSNADGNVEVPTDMLDRAIQDNQVKQRKPRKNKKLVDPNRPKRAPSAYMIWLAENRAAIKDELLTTNPDTKVTDVTKRAGALWKELADSEKTPFQTQADTLREQYYEQMKHYQPTYTAPSKSSKKEPYDVDDTPDAPNGWTGPHLMTYIKGTVKGIDGKTIRPIKNFAQAVDTVDNLIQAWKQARQNDDFPSHWDSNAPPCYGITKTISGYQPRLGAVATLYDTPTSKKSGGIASWVIQHDIPIQPSQNKKRARKSNDATIDATIDAVDDGKVATADDAVVEVADDGKIEAAPKAKTEAKPKPKSKPKAKKIAIKKKTPELEPEPTPTPVDVDECDEIEPEDDSLPETCLLHNETGMCYNPDDLFHPIAKLNDEGELELL